MSKSIYIRTMTAKSRENHEIPGVPVLLLWGASPRAAERYFNENDGKRIDSDVIIERIDWMCALLMLECAIQWTNEWMKINPTKT